jgi:ATP-dependent Clp protease ATP-binding subunit ClpB
LTSNLGSDVLAEPESTDEDGRVTAETRDAVLAQVAETFPPELINRLDSQVVFNKLSRRSILSIVDLRLADVSERLKDRRITLDVSQRAKEWLADQGYSEVYGARAVARVVRTKVLFPLAKKLLTGTIRCDSNLSPPLFPAGNLLYTTVVRVMS